MGHHIDANGNFQSDHHAWLPPNTILFSPKDRAVQQAFYAGYGMVPSVTVALPGKILISFDDPQGRVFLGEYLHHTQRGDEFADDIVKVLTEKYGWTADEFAKK